MTVVSCSYSRATTSGRAWISPVVDGATSLAASLPWATLSLSSATLALTDTRLSKPLVSGRPVLIGCCCNRLVACNTVTAGSILGARCCWKSSTSVGSLRWVSLIKPTNASLTAKVPSSTRLSMFSTAQHISPIWWAPTIRPEPFKVWKPRRISLSATNSWVSTSHTGIFSPNSARTSCASSMKISRISSSIL